MSGSRQRYRGDDNSLGFDNWIGEDLRATEKNQFPDKNEGS